MSLSVSPVVSMRSTGLDVGEFMRAGGITVSQPLLYGPTKLSNESLTKSQLDFTVNDANIQLNANIYYK